MNEMSVCSSLALEASEMIYQNISFSPLFSINNNNICKANVGNKPSLNVGITFIVFQCHTCDSL